MKPSIWILLTSSDQPGIDAVLPTIAWMAEETGSTFDAYIESIRNGRLFAKTGSTVLGGRHHERLNYLAASADIRIIKFGSTQLFDSSISSFKLKVVADSDSPTELYRQITSEMSIKTQSEIYAMPDEPVQLNGCDIRPYLFPDIFFCKRLGLNESDMTKETGFGKTIIRPSIEKDASLGELTLAIARKYADRSKGIAFGDPDAVRALVASLCRDKRIAVYQPRKKMDVSKIAFSSYTEASSPIASDAAELALTAENPVIIGRQTGDADIIEWSKKGVCIQIMDPDRPVFRSIETLPHPWKENPTNPYSGEPTDDELTDYASSGAILGSVVFHSGEIAHTEAMLNLFEFCAIHRLKIGVGVHRQRYETCPQLWELLNVDPNRGGVRGLVEPLLHSGGEGVLAEVHCPPEALKSHILSALESIRSITGETNVPHGYLSFMDAPLTDLSNPNPAIFQAISETGLDYCISSANPGLNRILYDDGSMIAINQSSRSVCPASPFVRITTIEDLIETGSIEKPGWILGTLDSPVIAFNDYIWSKGNRFKEITDFLLDQRRVINVLPHTLARYAKILKRISDNKK
ncbi:MAG: hypothetical protein ABIH86_02130 [Planctomycetota bacterium]